LNAVSSLDTDARQEIADTIHGFYYLVDHGEAAKTADLFTVDAQLIFGPGSPKPGMIEGVAIADAMKARENLKLAFTRHCICNIVLANAPDDQVSAQYMMILFRSDDETRSSAPAFVADVTEVWRNENACWKIAQRTITPTFFKG
jgi:hypothetical protein